MLSGKLIGAGAFALSVITATDALMLRSIIANPVERVKEEDKKSEKTRRDLVRVKEDRPASPLTPVEHTNINDGRVIEFIRTKKPVVQPPSTPQRQSRTFSAAALELGKLDTPVDPFPASSLAPADSTKVDTVQQIRKP
jgi:hypothetical protein